MKPEGLVVHGRSVKGHNHVKNDDRFTVAALDEENFLIGVSDGLGGHPGGDVAAEIVVDCLISIKINIDDRSILLKRAITQADKTIRSQIPKNPDLTGMGATATALIINNGWGSWAHIGDSRLYLLRNNDIRKITRDHSYIQGFIDSGDLSAKEAENHPMCNVLDQCVGCVVSGVETGRFKIHLGDILIICTDGLYRSVEETKIIELIIKSQNISQCVDQLIDASLQDAFCDDVTVTLAMYQ